MVNQILRKKLRNIIMLVLTLVLALQPTMSTYAVTTVGTPSKPANKGDGPFVYRNSYGVVGGFSRCLNGEGIKPFLDQGEDVYQAVQDYAAYYYMAAEGNKMVYWSTQNGWEGGWGVGKDGELTEASTVTGNLYAHACQVVADGTQASEPNLFTHYTISSGRYSYWQFNKDPAIKQMLIDSAASWDSAYYNLMTAETDDPYLAAHPVVWVFETAVYTSNGRVLYPSKLAKQYGVYDQLMSTPISGREEGTSTGRPNGTSCTAQFFLNNVRNGKYYEFHRLFGISMNTHRPESDITPRANSMFHEASDGGFDMGINGSSVWSLGLSGELPASIQGKFEWHMNAEGLKEINHFKEDNAVILTGDWQPKGIVHQVTSLKQDNLSEWYEWMDVQKDAGKNLYSVEVNSYWKGGSNFTTEYNSIKGGRNADPHDVVGGNTDGIVVQSGITDADLREIIQGKTLDWVYKSPRTPDVLAGDPIGEDRYQIAYVLTARLYNSDKTAWIDLANEQVHYAIYGSNADKTYIYNQVLTNPKSQVKEGGIGSESYEAMAGTPTTQDLFISQGGEQYLVQLQYRFVNDDYTRKYQVKSEADYPNFMYYSCNNSSNGKADTQASKEDSGYSGSHDNHYSSTDQWCKDQRKSDFETGRNQLANAIGNLISSIDNNYNARADYTSYTACQPQKVKSGEKSLSTIKSEVQSLTGDYSDTGKSKSGSWSATLAEGSDLDSEKSGSVTVKIEYSYSSGGFENGQYKKHEHTDGCSKDADNNYTCGSPDNRFKCWAKTTGINFTWSITISRTAFVTSPKNLSYNNEMLVTYQNVRYLDIVECHVYQMDKGKQTGLTPILATPTDTVIEAVAEKMGYVFYDSTSADSYSWDTSKKHWMCVPKTVASDLARTGRLLNSFNNRSVHADLPGGASYKWSAGNDLDHVIIEYDIGNGGRSNYSVNAFFAQLIGYMFYDENLKPRTNCLYITSDMLALNTGNGNTSGWEVFCFNQTDTSTETALSPQYILAEDGGSYLTARSMQLVKNKHQACSTINKENLTSRRYKEKHDLSVLNNGGTYANKYNKQYIAEGRNLDTDPHNGFVFYKRILEEGGVTYVGYRGDYQTSTTSHQPQLKSITAGWSPSSPITTEAYSLWKAGNWDAGKVNFANYAVTQYGGAVAENKSDQIATAGKEFPYRFDLNVNRTQANNRYKTGYAVLEYKNLVKLDVDHTSSLAGVTALIPSYKGKNLGEQSSLLSVGSPDFTARATYDNTWETPNDVVIFNPSSAQNSLVNEMSRYVPDLSGNGKTDANYPERDQRTTGQVAIENGNTVVTGSSDASSDTITLPTYKKKVLRPQSLLDTSYYKWDNDYVSSGVGEKKKMVLVANSTSMAPNDGDYTLQLYDSNGDATCVSIHLSKGDTLINDAGTVYKKARNAKVTWDQYVVGDIAGEGVNPFQITNTRTDTYHLDNIGTMKAGEIIHLQYVFENEVPQGSNPFSVSMPDVNATALLNPYMSTVNGHTWDCYIEAKEDTPVSELQVKFNITNKLVALPVGQNVLQFEDSFIMSTGDSYSKPAAQLSTMEWKHADGFVCAFNSNMCTYIDFEFTPPSITAFNCYIQYDAIKEVYRLRYESSLNPHIVHNTNWRYYVVGWYTSVGTTIASPTDSQLDNDDTVLRWPYSMGATITVGELKNSAVIVKWNGVVYLTTTEAVQERKILELGQIAEHFDTFTFAGDTSGLPEKLIEDNPGLYPLQGRGSNYGDAFYEWIFKCTDGTDADRPVYDVKTSNNLDHKFSIDDTNAALDTSSNVKECWEYDWEAVEDTASENAWGWASIRPGESTYLSLDDEFSIYFDNYGDFKEHEEYHNIGDAKVDLGYGWVEHMEVSTWIKDKYMKVEFPYYVFGWNDTYNMPDPTVTYYEYMHPEKFDANKHLAGTKIQLTYMGTELCHLGCYYTNGCGDCTSGNEQKCNKKHWVDFGEKNGYNYHFWVALSADEIRSTAVLLNSVNINNQGSPEENQQSINKDAPSGVYNRFANAMHKSKQAIVGRVGNLNIIDSGDFRFSDTFKTVKDTADWLVYGLIKEIDSYSNIKGTPSTQRALLTDPWDVRGIASQPDLLDPNVFTSEYDTYPASTEDSSNGFSTYQTQWHKSGGDTTNDDDNGSGDTYIASVPLSGNFNKHNSLKLTQQKLGYDNLLTLDSIGNYFGENRHLTTAGESDDLSAVNDNYDYNNYKIQIRPYYIALDANTGASYPVDVYWKPNGSYELMNTGSSHAKDWLKVMSTTSYNYYLDGNTGGKTSATSTITDGKSSLDAWYDLDNNMLRRMVTDMENKVTRSVCDYHGFQSMLDNPQKITDISGKDWGIDEKYCYGNSQYLFLRARNRTFVGRASQALKYDEYPIADYIDHLSHAQKWYFDLGLPATAVFIKSGESFSIEKIIQSEDIYILCCVDVYAIGEVWTLHYKSPVSKVTLDIGGNTWGGGSWNPPESELPYLIPVTFYCTGDTTAKGDLTTEGTH